MRTQSSTTLALALALVGCSRPNPAFGENTSLAGSESVGDGDGDGDPSTGDGDGDPSTGDGDGEPGDGDGVPGDGDGDGDGDGEPGDGDGEPVVCAAPIEYLDCDETNLGLTNDPLAAIGIDCDGLPEQTIPIVQKDMGPASAASWRVAKRFGLAPGPNHGGALWAAHESEVLTPGNGQPDIPPNTSSAILIMSTGSLPEPNFAGAVLLPSATQSASGDNGNPSAMEFPPPISPAFGSNFGQGGTPFENCDGVNDCSDSLHDQWFVNGWTALNNQLWLQFTVVPPAGVHGYMFDFAFFSSEYPLYIDTEFNDMFVAWSSSETYTGNLTFIGEAPMNTTSLADIDGFAHTGLDPALAGTGFETYASTEWLLARGPASPGEQVQLTLFLSDLGDKLLASVVLLDNFRWDCGGCQGTDCGFAP